MVLDRWRWDTISNQKTWYGKEALMRKAILLAVMAAVLLAACGGAVVDDGTVLVYKEPN